MCLLALIKLGCSLLTQKPQHFQKIKIIIQMATAPPTPTPAPTAKVVSLLDVEVEGDDPKTDPFVGFRVTLDALLEGVKEVTSPTGLFVLTITDGSTVGDIEGCGDGADNGHGEERDIGINEGLVDGVVNGNDDGFIDGIAEGTMLVVDG